MDNEKLQQKLEKMKARFEEERERVKAYEQIVKIYGAYMAVLLSALGATKDKPFSMKHSDITRGLEELETRAVSNDDGFDLFAEEVKK